MTPGPGRTKTIRMCAHSSHPKNRAWISRYAPLTRVLEARFCTRSTVNFQISFSVTVAASVIQAQEFPTPTTCGKLTFSRVKFRPTSPVTHSNTTPRPVYHPSTNGKRFAIRFTVCSFAVRRDGRNLWNRKSILFIRIYRLVATKMCQSNQDRSRSDFA